MFIEKDRAFSKVGDETIRSLNLLNALNRIGISQGDNICVHTEISSFGKPVIKDKDEYMQVIIDTIKLSVGNEGTIIMPTFTYSFCDKKVYDIQNTPSRMGILTEYFRKIPGVSRTRDPIFSFAIYGNKKQYYTDISNACFGEDSVYDKLYKQSGKLVLLGTRSKGYTFFHYIESCFKVSYRFNKLFSGTIMDNGIPYETTFDYYVRHLDRRSIPDIQKIINFLHCTKNFNEVPFANGVIVCIDVKRFFNDVYEKLNEDEEYFLEE